MDINSIGSYSGIIAILAIVVKIIHVICNSHCKSRCGNNTISISPANSSNFVARPVVQV